jgi:hypothetical protein
MRKELQSIIDEFDYEKALEWYKKHVQGKFFIKELLSKGKDQYNILKLKKELNEALASLQPEPVIKPISNRQLKEELQELAEDLKDELREEASQIFENKPKVKLVEQAAATPDEFLLDGEWKPKYKEANFLFGRLEFTDDIEKRKEMAFAILDLMDEVEEAWQKKDFLKVHGQLPNYENAGIEQLTPDQHATRIRTLRTYISKARKGKLDATRIPDWEGEIAEHERRLR